MLRPGMKVCAMQSRAARRRRGPGGGGRARGAAARVSSVPPALAAQVPPRSQWPPRSRSLRPARSVSSPAAPTPPRAAASAASAAAAARPPATLPLPLNSCAKYAALHLLGGSRAAPGSPARETGRPRAPPALRNPALPPPPPNPTSLSQASPLGPA